jgi:NitT/TauT family transport system ATP-binding protein
LYIHIEHLSKDYKQNGVVINALNDVSLTIERREFICILGSSGCGKTTLLNLLGGFERPSRGIILIDGEEIKGTSPKYVTIFQNYHLLPWRTVKKNVELGLEAKKLSKKAMHAISSKYINLVGLEKFSKAHPYQLSGGMQQRVAIACALAVDPDIIFMDEPFGALDALTRIKMQDEILTIQRQQKKTIVFVTHDIDEAVFLADRIVVMAHGEIKNIIPVNFGDHRDRTNDDFLKIRNKVFAEFEMTEKEYANIGVSNRKKLDGTKLLCYDKL